MALEIFTTEQDGRFFAEVYEARPDRGISDSQDPAYATGFYATESEARADAEAWAFDVAHSDLGGCND